MGEYSIEWLKSLCHFLAQQPQDTFDASMLANRIGRHDSALAAFVGGENAPSSMRGYATDDRKLHGWRCLQCGHSEASSRDIENLIAQDVVPKLIFQSCQRCTLDKLVDQSLAFDIPDLDTMRQSLATEVTGCGIALVDRDGWMRPCPNCGNNDTAVYRWRLVVSDELGFEPADDNLPMHR